MKERRRYCIACGSVAEPRVREPGSCLIEIVLWALFVVPGLIYTLWRWTTPNQFECRACASRSTVPLSSPAAVAALAMPQAAADNPAAILEAARVLASHPRAGLPPARIAPGPSGSGDPRNPISGGGS